MLNGMRDRVVVQVDGQLKTGRDVVIGALLGAEEFGFATAPLVVQGCVMMRVCHLDTCPVGVATQNPELRKRFSGKPEFVVNFFEFIAQEVREYLAELGYRSLDEIIGRRELLDVDRAVDHWKASGLDLTPVLLGPDFSESDPRRNTRQQDHELEQHFDNELIRRSSIVLDEGGSVEIALPIRNTERAVGTMLGHEVTLRRGEHGLPTGSIDITLTGSAGQSLGAFLPSGITLRLEGDSNDYVGKGLSGGQIVVRPAARQRLRRRAQRHRGQRDRLRRDARQHVHPRHRRRAIPRSQLGCDRGRRGRGRPRARVHDRWARAHPRRDRAQPRCRHVGRHRLRARPARGPDEPRVAHER